MQEVLKKCHESRWSQYERTRLLPGGCREKTLNNHINVDALIQKGACNEARQVYMGMDVHEAMTVVAVIDAEVEMVLETIVATRTAPIRRLIESISGPVHITFEETTLSGEGVSPFRV